MREREPLPIPMARDMLNQLDHAAGKLQDVKAEGGPTTEHQGVIFDRQALIRGTQKSVAGRFFELADHGFPEAARQVLKKYQRER